MSFLCFASCFSRKKSSDIPKHSDLSQLSPHEILSFPTGILSFPVHSQSSSSLATMDARPPSAPLECSAEYSSVSATSLPMRQFSFQPKSAARSATSLPKSFSDPEGLAFRSDCISARYPSLTLAASPQLPSLQFSLFHDFQHRSIEVQLHRAYNLPPKGQFRTCNPFVNVFVLPNKKEVFTSKMVEKDFHPIFDDRFHFTLVSSDESYEQTLVFQVFDHVKFLRNEFIGSVVVPLKHADMLGDTVVKTIDENPNLFQDFASASADIHFSLKYDDHNMCLQGLVDRATNLDKQDTWGLADPYVSIDLLYKGKKNKKWKTKVQRKTLNPVFNESFQFDISHLDIQDISLEFVLMDYDRFGRDDLVGVVQVGPHAAMERGRTHWQQMLFSPQHEVSMWHPVKTPAKSKKK